MPNNPSYPQQKFITHRAGLSVLGAALLAVNTGVSEQRTAGFPANPSRYMPSRPGGLTDLMRLIGLKVAEKLGQSKILHHLLKLTGKRFHFWQSYNGDNKSI